MDKREELARRMEKAGADDNARAVRELLTEPMIEDVFWILDQLKEEEKGKGA